MPDAPDDPTESEIAGDADKLETMLRGSHPSVNIFFQPDNLGALPALWLQAKLTISLTSIQDKFAKLFMTIAAELWLRGRIDTLEILLWLLSFCWLPLWLWCLRFGPLFPVPPPPLPPWLSPGVFWSSQCSAGPSLRISGCICNGPVVIPLVWRVVVDWLLSSLRSLATKASALCGALPSTPCCGCCSCAPRSVTEVFAFV